jgi:hypothetical protein
MGGSTTAQVRSFLRRETVGRLRPVVNPQLPLRARESEDLVSVSRGDKNFIGQSEAVEKRGSGCIFTMRFYLSQGGMQWSKEI